MTSDHLKTILLTSALAALGGAVASTFATYIMEKYVFTEDRGPMFVVVPIVGGLPPGTATPAPALPVAGFGAEDSSSARGVALAGAAGIAIGYLLAKIALGNQGQ